MSPLLGVGLVMTPENGYRNITTSICSECKKAKHTTRFRGRHADIDDWVCDKCWNMKQYHLPVDYPIFETNFGYIKMPICPDCKLRIVLDRIITVRIHNSKDKNYIMIKHVCTATDEEHTSKHLLLKKKT